MLKLRFRINNVKSFMVVEQWNSSLPCQTWVFANPVNMEKLCEIGEEIESCVCILGTNSNKFGHYILSALPLVSDCVYNNHVESGLKVQSGLVIASLVFADAVVRFGFVDL